MSRRFERVIDAAVVVIATIIACVFVGVCAFSFAFLIAMI